MGLDKNALQLFKANFTLAAMPTFKPVPDESIADEAERDRIYQDALKRAALSRELAIVDIVSHSAAAAVCELLPGVWAPGAADEGFDPAAMLADAQAAIAAGDGDSLAKAGTLLLAVGFLKLIKE